MGTACLKYRTRIAKKSARKNLLVTLRRPMYFLPIAATLATLAVLFAVNQGQQFAATQAEKTAIATTIRDLGSKECEGNTPKLSENETEIVVTGAIEVINELVVFDRHFRCIAHELPIYWTAIGQQLAAMRDGDGNIAAGELARDHFVFRWESGNHSGGFGNSHIFQNLGISNFFQFSKLF